MELPNNLIDTCKASGGYGYILNSSGKLVFSEEPVQDTLSGIIQVDESILAPAVTPKLREEMAKYNVPATIIGNNKDISKSYFPDRYFENVTYKNRVYVYGVLDCYTLIRDYFRDKYNVWIPANIDRSFGWWHNGRNLYVDMYSEYGFTETTDLIRKDDVLLFKFDNGMPSHSAIYIGEGMMLHHMIGRLSCIEKFDGIYKMSLAGVLRYNGNLE